MSSLGELVVSIIGDIGQLKKAFTEVGTHASQMGSKLQSVGASVSSTGSAMTKGITAPLLAVGAGIAVVTNSAVGFEKQMAEVFTLLPGLSKEGMGQLTADTLEFSKELGVTTSQAVPALYQAISAGVPKDNVFEFLEVAQKAAVGGVTELEVAVDGITSVINAYGTDVLSAGEASDLMFTAVRLGKTTFDELANSLYNVIPTASALGVEFGDVTAAMAAMTAQGTPTSVATTQLRQLFVELSKEGTKTSDVFKEIAGVSFRDFIAQGGNTQEALQLLEQYAKETGIGINDLFGSVEAGNAALALTGKGTEAFANALGDMANAAGATQAAYDTMDDTVARSMEKIKAEINVLAIELGNEFLPILKDDILPIIKDVIVPFLTGTVAPALKAMIKLFTDMPAPLQLAIVGITGLLAALGPILMIVGPIISGVGGLLTFIGGAGGLSAVIAGLGTTLSGVVAVITGPVGIALAALALAAYVIYKNWGKIGPVLKNTFNQIKEAVAPVIHAFKEFVSDALEQIRAWWDTNGDTITAAVMVLVGALEKLVSAFLSLYTGAVKKALPPILSLVKYILGQVLNYIVLVAQLITGDWDGAWKTIQKITQTAMDFLSSIISSVMSWVKDKVTEYVTGIYTTWYNRWNDIKEAVRTILSTVLSIVTSTISVIVSGVLSYLSTLKSRTFTSLQEIVTSIFTTLSDAVSTFYEMGAKWIQSLIDGITSKFSALSSAVSSALNFSSKSSTPTSSSGSSSASKSTTGTLSNTLSNVSGALSSAASTAAKAGSSIMTNLASGITSAASKVTSAVSKVVSSVRNYFPFSPAKEGALKKLPNWDAFFVDPILESTKGLEGVVQSRMNDIAGMVPPIAAGQASGAASTATSQTNNIGGNTLVIQNMTLSKDYPFEQFMRDYENRMTQARVQRGIRG